MRIKGNPIWDRSTEILSSDISRSIAVAVQEAEDRRVREAWFAIALETAGDAPSVPAARFTNLTVEAIDQLLED